MSILHFWASIWLQRLIVSVFLLVSCLVLVYLNLLCLFDSFDKYGGGPTLAKDDYCTDCIFEIGSNMRRANIYRDQRSLMKEIAEAALSGEPLDGTLYYISKSWYVICTKNVDCRVSTSLLIYMYLPFTLLFKMHSFDEAYLFCIFQ